MQTTVSARPPRTLKAIVLFVAMLGAMLPLVAHAGVPGTVPAAARIALTMQFTGGDQSLTIAGDGVVNRNGDLHLTLAANGPEPHTIDLIKVDGTTYTSADGGPYDVINVPGLGGAGMLPPGCTQAPAAPSGFGDLHTVLGPSVSLQDLGSTTVDGANTMHIAIHADLLSALDRLAPILNQTLAACGLGTENLGSLPPQARQQFAGSTLDMDLYLEQPGDFPRRIVLTINAPAVPLQATIQEDLTPLSAPVPITPPV